MNWYQKWLQEEKEWIGIYQKKVLRMSILQVIPGTLIGLAALFGLLSVVGGDNFLEGAGSGLMLGVFVAVIYLLFLILALSPSRYVRKIKSAVKKMNMDETEKQQLARELLDTNISKWRCISFVIDGHGSRATPGRFRITPHYAFLEGSYPYAILVRLSDMLEVYTGEETKTRAQHGAQTRTFDIFTLHTILFYKNPRTTAAPYADQAMGFFDANIRNQCYELIVKQMEENKEHQKERTM